MSNLFNYVRTMICGPCLNAAYLATNTHRRLAKRKFQYWKSAHVVLSSSLERRKCTLLDFSATGARIKLKGADTAFPQPQDQLTLVVSVDEFEVDCEVVWSKRKCVGLQFRGAFRPTGASAQPYD